MGIEYKSNHKQAINGFVLEYYQTTNQSGPMHGVDFTVVEKTEVQTIIITTSGIPAGYTGNDYG